MTKDLKEGVEIGWNPYGKVRNVTKSDSTSVRFRYDAAGNRIAKITDSDSTVYVRDASGNVIAVYKNDTLIEQSIYGSSRLGLHRVASRPGYRTLGNKQYELSNHLGNVMAVVTDNIHLNQDSTWAQVSSISDYYPFGLTMEGRSLSDSTYRYGFNAKEKDSNGEWGSKSHYDYGFRIYNPFVARFLSVDPLTKSYPMLTPYQFASNTPIQAIDLDGLEAIRYPGVGTTTDMLEKPTEEEIREVYSAYKGIALGVWDFATVFSPQARMLNSNDQIDPNYIPLYSEVKEAYKGIKYTIEQGSTEDKFRLATVGALSVYGGAEALSKIKIPSILSSNKALPTDEFYSVAFEAKIPNSLYPGKGAYSHFKAANISLFEAMESNASFSNSMKRLGISVPRTSTGTITGNKIPDWVWHHSTERGVMQLVPQTQHTSGSIFWNSLHPEGRGGMSIWGGGYRKK